MSVLLGAAAGAAAAWVGWLLVGPVLSSDVFARTNHRGVSVATAAGLVLLLVVVAFEAVAVLGSTVDLDLNPVTVVPRRTVLVLTLGLGALGLLDDLAGVGQSGGFRGHLEALMRGRLTTGSIKLFGGGAVAVVAVIGPRSDTAGRLLADAALVALCANLANLLDRAPGRMLKASTAAFVALAVATGLPAELLPVAVVAGGGLALLWPDLREQAMLGDIGANIVGGALGAGVVVATAPATRNWALVAVAALNAVSELVSFSTVIDSVRPLRVLDRAGRVDRESEPGEPGQGTD